MNARERLLDVSELEPPEPLELTLESATRLSAGEYLRMLHRRFPCLLFDNLDKQGYGHLIRSGRETACEVFIWRRDDAMAAEAAHAAAKGLSEWRE